MHLLNLNNVKLRQSVRNLHVVIQRALVCSTLLTTAGIASGFAPMTLDSYFESKNYQTAPTTYSLPTVTNASTGTVTRKLYKSYADILADQNGVAASTTGPIFTQQPFLDNGMPNITQTWSNATTDSGVTGTLTHTLVTQNGAYTVYPIYDVVTDALGQVAIKTCTFNGNGTQIVEDTDCAPAQVTAGIATTIASNFYDGFDMQSRPFSGSISPSQQGWTISPLNAAAHSGNSYTTRNGGTITWGTNANSFTYAAATTPVDDYFAFLIKGYGTQGQVIAKSFYYKAPPPPATLADIAPKVSGYYVVPTGAGTAAISGVTTLTENVIVNTNGRDLTISAAVTQATDRSYGMTFVGGGTVTFSGGGISASTYTGPTLCDLATTLVGVPASSQNCSKVRVAPANTYTENGVISGEGTLYVDSSNDANVAGAGGTLRLGSNSNAYKGYTVINNATVQLGTNTAIPTVTDQVIVLVGAKKSGGNTYTHEAVLQIVADVSMHQPIHVLSSGVIDTNGCTFTGGTNSTSYKSVFGPGDLVIRNTTSGNNWGTYTLKGEDARTGATVIDGKVKVMIGDTNAGNKFTDTTSLTIKSGEINVMSTLTSNRGLVLAHS